MNPFVYSSKSDLCPCVSDILEHLTQEVFASYVNGQQRAFVTEEALNNQDYNFPLSGQLVSVLGYHIPYVGAIKGAAIVSGMKGRQEDKGWVSSTPRLI